MKIIVKKIVRKIFKSNKTLNIYYDRLSKFKDLLRELKPFYEKYKRNKNLVFLIFTPDHSNLGDHAIAYSEIKLLNQLDIEFVEIPYFLLYRIADFKLLRIFNNKKVLIHGGGYLGTLWFREEIMLRKIVKAAPKAHLFFFPNTIYYENSEFGKLELEKSKKIYNNHKKISFCAREEYSYKIMKDSYIDVKLIPDMVLFLNECKSDYNRNGCVVCLRNDPEKTLTDTQHQTIYTQAEMLFGKNITITDMCLADNLDIKYRNNELQNKFTEFRNAELVITDRLHGMIFCAITGTPCLVLNSKSHKLKGCYEWIKHLEYIKFIDNESDIATTFQSIPKKQFTYDNTYLQEYYDILKEAINNILLR